MKNQPRFLFSALMLVATLVAGCAGTPQNKSGVMASKDEYESVTPLGSNIPVMVKKGEKPVTASPTEAMTGDQLSQSVHRAGGQATPGNN